ATSTGGTSGTGGVQPTGGAAGATGGSTNAGAGGADSAGSSPGGAAGTSEPTGGSAGESGGAAGASPGGSGGSLGGGGSGGAGGRGGAAGGGAAGGTSSSQSTIVPDPSWTCGLPNGIPAPTRGELVFSATLQVGMNRDAGMTSYGRRRVVDITGGMVTGSRVQATVLTGGFDFELTLSNGSVELEQIDVLRASDGTLIYMRSCGVAPPGASEIRIVPDFEVANSRPLAWLNTGKFVGTRVLDGASNTVRLEVYDVANVTDGDPRVRITDPTDKPQQPWNCSTATGPRGASVFTENVTLGSSLSVGASKRGTRNIIPITGGTVTGRFTGSILPGGADYQLIGSPTTLDARYVLRSNDGELVLVRNCGPFGALVPLFEAKADGAYAFLNSNDYVSSDPGTGGGGVSITFYERN
ncbi:MAG TPA: DUF3237 domain-containing protein, partial [Polyangiaceae bacterium]